MEAMAIIDAFVKFWVLKWGYKMEANVACKTIRLGLE